jgi:hypothetical protein
VSKKGKPKFNKFIGVDKTPKVAVSRESCYPHRPSWRVGLMEMVDPFGWHEVEGEKLRLIRSQLAGIEGNTWKDILVRDGKHNHFIAVEKICPEAQERLRALHLDDTDALVSLRVGGAERIWGILELNVLKVLWWDPEHLIYPMNLADN